MTWIRVIFTRTNKQFSLNVYRLQDKTNNEIYGILIVIIFTDDLITPVYVAPTRLPTTLRPKHNENIQERPSCDDEEEDCEEGSGEPGTTEEIVVTSVTGPCLPKKLKKYSYFIFHLPRQCLSILPPTHLLSDYAFVLFTSRVFPNPYEY